MQSAALYELCAHLVGVHSTRRGEEPLQVDPPDLRRPPDFLLRELGVDLVPSSVIDPGKKVPGIGRIRRFRVAVGAEQEEVCGAVISPF